MTKELTDPDSITLGRTLPEFATTVEHMAATVKAAREKVAARQKDLDEAKATLDMALTVFHQHKRKLSLAADALSGAPPAENKRS